VLDQLPVPMICMDVANGYSEHFVQVRPLPRASLPPESHGVGPVSYTHLRAHET